MKKGQRFFDLALLAALIIVASRFVHTGALAGVGQLLIGPSWFGEQLPPLLALIDERPPPALDVRQYGVVVFLLLDPVLRLTNKDLGAAEIYVLLLDLAATALSFMLVVRRLGLVGRTLLIIGGAWLSFAPLLLGIAERQVDPWLLVFLCAGFYLFTAPDQRHRRTSMIPVVLGMLTKLLPGLVAAGMALRHPRSALPGILAGLMLLVFGGILYGPGMGVGYPVHILSSSPEAVAVWATHHENNSLRGLIFKAAAGFKVMPAPDGRSSGHVAQSVFRPVLDMASAALVVLIVVAVAVMLIRARPDHSTERRLLDFVVLIVAMLLVSPHTSHEMTVVTLPVFTALYWLWRRSWPVSWDGPLLGAAILSAGLIGVFVPMGLLAPLLRHAMELTGNAGLIAPNIGAYDLLGLPGVGLVLVALVLARLAIEAEKASGAGPPSRTALKTSN